MSPNGAGTGTGTETGTGIGTEIGNFICQQTWQRKRVEKYATAAAEGTLLIPAKRPHHVDEDDDETSDAGAV